MSREILIYYLCILTISVSTLGLRLSGIAPFLERFARRLAVLAAQLGRTVVCLAGQLRELQQIGADEGIGVTVLAFFVLVGAGETGGVEGLLVSLVAPDRGP